VADSKILKKGTEDNLTAPRTTKYMPFTRKKRLFEKYEPIGGGGRPHPLESATDNRHIKIDDYSLSFFRFNWVFDRNKLAFL